MHHALQKGFLTLRCPKNWALLSLYALLSCGPQTHQSAHQSSNFLLQRKSNFEQGLNYLDSGLRNRQMVGDETTRKRRWRLQWDPGGCTNPKGSALEITTNTDSFNYGNAYWLSWLSIQAYRRSDAAEQLEKMGLSKIDFIDNRSTSFQAFVGSNEKYVVVSFAGTSELVDYLTDVTFASKPETVSGIPGRVHTGFVNVLDKSWPELLKLVREHSTAGQPVILTGHSLGGAQAVLTAARLAVMGFPVDSIYIYAVPRTGDEEYARFVTRLFPNRIYRFVNNEDLVPRLPPPKVAAETFSQLFPEDSREPVRAVFETLKYTHVGQLLLQDAKGQLSLPRAYSEAEDIEYWKTVGERSRGRSIPAAVFANWRMLFDHIPFAGHCQLKPPKQHDAGSWVSFTD